MKYYAPKHQSFHLHSYYINKRNTRRLLRQIGLSKRTNTAYLFRGKFVWLGGLLILLRFPLFAPLVWSWIQTKINKFEEQYINIPVRKHADTSSKIFSTFSTIQSHDKHVDWLPFFCACLAVAACLVLRSVKALSDSALGILSKEKKRSKSLPKKANSSLWMGTKQ